MHVKVGGSPNKDIIDEGTRLKDSSRARSKLVTGTSPVACLAKRRHSVAGQCLTAYHKKSQNCRLSEKSCFPQSQSLL